MIIGVPREIKAEEYRVGMTPAGAARLTGLGHTVLIEPEAGLGSGFEDAEYAGAGAEILGKEELFRRAGMVVKVKEPLPSEYGLLRTGQWLFTYLHLAPNRPLLCALLDSGVTALAYETLVDAEGGLPMLRPMSEVAGRMSVLMGAYYLQKPKGGRGVLPMGATGVEPARIAVLGAGTVGENAVRVAVGLGMHVTLLNRGAERLAELDRQYGRALETMPLTKNNIEKALREADIVVGAVYVKGQAAPKLVTRGMLGLMRPGSVLVDVSIDQGGCFETSRPTTHTEPTYLVDGIVHYAVANMPGAYPRTSTLALTSATLPYIERMAAAYGEGALGALGAVAGDAVLASAVNVHEGRVRHEGLARSTGMEYVPLK